MVWSAPAGGLLSGKYRRGQQAAVGRRLTERSEPPVRDEEKLHDTVETVVDIASAHGAAPPNPPPRPPPHRTRRSCPLRYRRTSSPRGGGRPSGPLRSVRLPMRLLLGLPDGRGMAGEDAVDFLGTDVEDVGIVVVRAVPRAASHEEVGARGMCQFQNQASWVTPVSIQRMIALDPRCASW